MADCDNCGAIRPRWHGGAHVCLSTNGSYQLGHGRKYIDEQEMRFLSADYAGLR